MENSMLEDLLRAIVKHYGIKRVETALRKLRHTGDEHTRKTEFGESAQNKNQLRQSYLRKRPKMTAPLYISKLVLSTEIHQLLTQLADMFEDKKFLPTIGEVRNFCIVHGIDEPSTSSRVAAIPRVFGFLATLSANDIQVMLQSKMFFGPSRLAPIADAIRRNAKHRMETDTATRRITKPSTEDPVIKPSILEKPSVPKKI